MEPAGRAGGSGLETSLLPRAKPTATKFWPALLNQFKSVFGTGLLSLPWAMEQVGVAFAVPLTLLIGSWCCYTMHLIATCYKLCPHPVSNLGDLVSSTLGPLTGAILGAGLLVLHQLLVCAAYLVFIGDSLASVFDCSSAAIMVVATAPFAALCCLRDLTLLAPTSAVGTALLGIVIAMVLFESLMVASTERPAASDAAMGGSGLASFLGVVLYTFAGHSETLPIARSMGDEVSRYHHIAGALLGLAVPAVTGFSAVAAVAHGAETPVNILLAFHSGASSALKAAMSAAIFFSLPLKMAPATQTLEPLLPCGDGPLLWLRPALRVGLALISTTLGLTLPDFGFLVAFIGAFCIGIIAFMLPPAMLLVLARPTGAWRALHEGLLVLGCAVTVGATAKVVIDKFAGGEVAARAPTA